MPESVNGQEAVSLEQLKTLNDSYADRFIPYASSSAIANANDWLTTGYAKTSTSTTNLPAECTGTSMWGVLLFVAENAEMGTGTQQFFPIDGDQKGQMFVRSLTRLLATEPIIGDWHKLATESYVKDYVEEKKTKTQVNVSVNINDVTGVSVWYSNNDSTYVISSSQTIKVDVATPVFVLCDHTDMVASSPTINAILFENIYRYQGKARMFVCFGDCSINITNTDNAPMQP